MSDILNKEIEKIAVITDSCSDIPEELRAKYNIYVLPLLILCKDGEYRDGVDITAQDIYERLKTELPKTSTPKGEEIENLFIELEKNGYKKAIAVMLSGGLSGTANHVRLAAEESNLDVCVVDSKSGSIGTGAIALQAAIWLEEGMEYEQLCKKVTTLFKHTHVFFSIDTLEYLQKGGRIGKATAMVGTALNIKPILSFEEGGEICTAAKVRGRKLVEKKLLQLVEEKMNLEGTPNCKYNLMIADGGAPEERDALEEKITKLFPDYQNLFPAKIGAGLSTYLGDGMLGAGIQFLAEDSVDM